MKTTTKEIIQKMYDEEVTPQKAQEMSEYICDDYENITEDDIKDIYAMVMM